jgi:hypothetical protein
MVKVLRSMLLASLVLPSLATAQVSLGLRAGYAFPAGDAYDFSGVGTFKQKEFAKGMVPLQLEAAWRFTPAVSAGLYYSYGFGITGSKLDELCSTPGATCDRPVFQRFGVAATYRTVPMAGIAPWASLGAGMEIGSFKVKQFAYNLAPFLTADLDGTFRGWNANVGLGADWAMGKAAIGPYVQLDVGQYTVQHVTLAGQGTVAGGGIASPKTHEWITIGLRGTFDLL